MGVKSNESRVAPSWVLWVVTELRWQEGGALLELHGWREKVSRREFLLPARSRVKTWGRPVWRAQ